MSVLIESSLGVFVIDLYVKERPRCSLNFLKLCQLKYYNFCLFHSVQKNLVAQTGDPTGSGRGGASVFHQIYGEQARYFDAEKKPKIPHSRRGLVSMVENGHGQHGSQFFITLADHLDYLDGKHTVFGYLAEGQDFLDKINEVYCDKDYRPFRNVRIHHTIILDDPFETPKDLQFPLSPARIPISLQGEVGPPRIEEDEELEEEVGLSPSQVGEIKAEQEAKTHAQLLTLIGDLPDPNIKPPDNVLFVCRLNPVTQSEDLEIIFSRFGEIKSCEVIRDKRTGASLQYAFIEFENESDCENAFFKMDKVVIDDRRIHVDFSQSVAKEWQRHRAQQEKEKLSQKSTPPSLQRPHGEKLPRFRSDKRHLEHRPDRRRSPPAVNRHTRDRRVPHSSVRERDHDVRRRPSPRSGNRYDERGAHRRPESFNHSPVDRRRRSSSPHRKVVERPEPEKHQPLPGTDLDLVISESDIDSSSGSSSSGSNSRHAKKKRRKHRHRSTSHDRHKHEHHKKSKKLKKHRHKKHSHSRE